MKDNPSVDTVYATSDGQLFFGKNSAELHRDTNAAGDKLTVFVFGAAAAFDMEAEIVPALAPNQHNVNEVSIPEFEGLSTEALIGEIAKVEDLSVLTVLQAMEDNGEKRASILAAIGQRNAQLVAALPLNKSNTNAEVITAKGIQDKLDEQNGKASEKVLNAKDSITKVNAVMDVKVLDEMEKAEVEGQNRKTVIEAIGNRNAQLFDAAKNDTKRKEDDN